MHRFTIVLLMLLALPALAAADAAQDFLNTPVWYLSYEVSFKSSSQGSFEGGFGPMAYTASVDRVFTHTQVLNLRSQGPGALAMMPMATQQGQSGGGTSIADAQKASMDLMAKMDHTANWIVGGSALSESQSEADVQADVDATMGDLLIRFQRNEKGDNLVDEMGNKFSITRSETVTGTSKAVGGGFGSIMLDVDTSKKTYLLSLSVGGGGEFDRTLVEVVHVPGQAPEERKETNKADDARVKIVLDEQGPVPMGGGLVVSGSFDPASGKISGENTYQAHYHDGTADSPGNLVVKYTLTPTPPAKKVGGK
ncbi:MAG TPA: hypothetical protein VFU38_11335 [Candidatus Krumholzibacteria bacterium]|nr:hypothetical protein [Candidatus Krumholzibacteria bacterium]